MAVLPFEDLGAAEDDYFAAGISEEIISRLAAVQGLRVISRTTVVAYDRSGKNIRQVGRDLDADYVLEGTVRWDRAGPAGRVRITPQLIRAADDTHLWAGRYDREMGDIFALQSDIAGQVVRALGVTLSEREQSLIEVRPTANLEAYQLYLRGLQALADGQAGRREDDYLLAMADLMRRATELDPEFALAHARRTHALAWSYFLGGPADFLAQARNALEARPGAGPRPPRRPHRRRLPPLLAGSQLRAGPGRFRRRLGRAAEQHRGPGRRRRGAAPSGPLRGGHHSVRSRPASSARPRG